MIRTILAATFLVTAAQAETAAPDIDHERNLAFCGSQVATLAWFYQGVVDDGQKDVQKDLDSLLLMQGVFFKHVEALGEESTDLFTKMTKTSVDELAEQMQGTEEEGALALSHVNTNVRSCADMYFEKIED